MCICEHSFSRFSLSSLLLTGLVMALYASFYQADLCFTNFVKRLVLTEAVSIGPIFTGMVFWASVYYPVTLLHLVFTIAFSLNYVASFSFNSMITGVAAPTMRDCRSMCKTNTTQGIQQPQ